MVLTSPAFRTSKRIPRPSTYFRAVRKSLLDRLGHIAFLDHRDGLIAETERRQEKTLLRNQIHQRPLTLLGPPRPAVVFAGMGPLLNDLVVPLEDMPADVVPQLERFPHRRLQLLVIRHNRLVIQYAQRHRVIPFRLPCHPQSQIYLTLSGEIRTVLPSFQIANGRPVFLCRSTTCRTAFFIAASAFSCKVIRFFFIASILRQSNRIRSSEQLPVALPVPEQLIPAWILNCRTASTNPSSADTTKRNSESPARTASGHPSPAQNVRPRPHADESGRWPNPAGESTEKQVQRVSLAFHPLQQPGIRPSGQRRLKSEICAAIGERADLFEHSLPARIAARSGANGDNPIAIRSAFTKFGHRTYSGKNIRAKVVLPDPFGPAMIYTFFFRPLAMPDSSRQDYTRSA